MLWSNRLFNFVFQFGKNADANAAASAAANAADAVAYVAYVAYVIGGFRGLRASLFKKPFFSKFVQC